MNALHAPQIPDGGRRCMRGANQSLASLPCGLLEEEHATPEEIDLRLVAGALERLVREEYPAGPLSAIARIYGFATPEEVAALDRYQQDQEATRAAI